MHRDPSARADGPPCSLLSGLRTCGSSGETCSSPMAGRETPIPKVPPTGRGWNTAGCLLQLSSVFETDNL